MRTTAFLATLGLLLSACATARVETSWKDPAVGPSDFAFEKVLVMVRDVAKSVGGSCEGKA